jgi:hypothetical protein
VWQQIDDWIVFHNVTRSWPLARNR